MRLKALVLAAGALTLLAGCVPAQAPSASPAATATGKAITPTIPRVTPSVPALGSWTPTCKSATADARALVANLTAQPAFAVELPSSGTGFAAAAAQVVAPLQNCAVAHSLAVTKAVTVGEDDTATRVVQDEIAALLRTITLTLSESKVGRATFGASMSTLEPTLVAVLGEPDSTRTQSCELSGLAWTTLSWGSLRISFDATTKSKPLDSWRLRPDADHPANLAFGRWPAAATVAELKKISRRCSR